MAETQTQTQESSKTADPAKEREKRQKESDERVKKFLDEERKQDVKVKHDDDFKKLGEKLNKAREKFLEIEAIAADTTDPNVEQLRDIRTRANTDYQTLLDKINSTARQDIDKPLRK